MKIRDYENNYQYFTRQLHEYVIISRAWQLTLDGGHWTLGRSKVFGDKVIRVSPMQLYPLIMRRSFVLPQI